MRWTAADRSGKASEGHEQHVPDTLVTLEASAPGAGPVPAACLPGRSWTRDFDVRDSGAALISSGGGPGPPAGRWNGPHLHMMLVAAVRHADQTALW